MAAAPLGLIAWIVLGLIAGLIAKALMPSKNRGGCFITVVIGILGALLGGFLSSALRFGGLSELGFRSIIIAILGSIILLAIWGLMRGRKV